MGVSLRLLQRILVTGLAVWMLLMVNFLQQREPFPTSPRWRENDFHSTHRGKVRRYHRQQSLMNRQDRQLGRQQHPNDATSTNGTDEEMHRIDPTNGNPKPFASKAQHFPRKIGRTLAQKARGWRILQQDDDDQIDNQYNSSKIDLKLPLPVIVMGFPKAGTSSIFAFFRRQGFRSQHWYCCNAQSSPRKGGPDLMAACMMKNIRRNHTNIFDGCGKGYIEVFSEINGPRRKKYHPFTGKLGYLQDDGTVDYEGPGNRIFLPQHFWIDRVHNAFPNATWILNLRDVDSWIGSVIKWGDDLHNQFFNEYFMQGAITDIPSENNSTAVNNLLREIYEQHHDMVREFVREHPSHNLVEVNITDESAGAILGQAFGLDSRAWANINRNTKGQRGSWQDRAYPFDELNYFDSPFWWLCFIGTTVYLGWFLGVEVSNLS